MSQTVTMQMMELLRQIQPLGQFETDTPLFDSGYMDSIIIFDRLLPALEEMFQITVEPPELVPENFETPRAIVRYVESKKSAAASGKSERPVAECAENERPAAECAESGRILNK